MPTTEKNILNDIAKLIIREGTNDTCSGNYIFEFCEIAEKLGIEESAIAENTKELREILESHESAAYVGINESSIDIDFYLEFCKNLDPDSYLICYPYLDDGTDIPHWQARSLDEAVGYIFAHEYPCSEKPETGDMPEDRMLETKRGYVKDIEAYGVSLNDIHCAPDLWNDLYNNAIRHLKYLCGIDDAQLYESVKNGELPSHPLYKASIETAESDNQESGIFSGHETGPVMR